MLSTSFFEPFNEANTQLLLALYAESCRASQPLRRDLVLDLIISHAPPSADPLAAARGTLRLLEDAGWLRVEIQPDAKPACVLTPRAFQFLQALSTTSMPLAELAAAIADLLKIALVEADNAARLASAARLAGQALAELKQYQHNAAAGRLPDTAAQCAAVRDSAARLEARGYADAGVIRERFEAFERLRADIDARQSRSLPARREQPEVAGPLAAVICGLAAADKKAFAKQTESLVSLYGVSAFAAPAPTPAPAFLPDDAVWPQPSLAEIAAARQAVAHEFNRSISPDRVRRHAAALLQGQPYVRAADLVREGRADLPLLIQFRLHADDVLGYTVEDQPWVEMEGLVFRDFILHNSAYIEPASLEAPAGAPPGEPQPAGALESEPD